MSERVRYHVWRQFHPVIVAVRGGPGPPRQEGADKTHESSLGASCLLRLFAAWVLAQLRFYGAEYIFHHAAG